MTDLSAHALTVGYRGRPVLSDVELTLRPGRIAVMIGPNGAGKSTLLRALAGSLEPMNGAVLLDGQELRGVSLAERARKLAVMTTARRSPEYATCFDVVSVGRFQFTGVTGKLRPDDVKAIDDALELVGASELRDADFLELSDGQKQRVLLARAIAQEPKIMLLDEPTSFLDVGYKLEFIAALRRLVRERQIAVLASLHELELVRNAADDVICVSRDGRVDRIGAPGDVFQLEYLRNLFNVKDSAFDAVYGPVAVSPPRPAGGDDRRDALTGADCADGADSARTAANSDAAASSASSDPAASSEHASPRRRARFIMVQGTMSSAGKSLVAAGLCRVLAQDGFRVAPFKSQNMALNSFVTADGLEMGRAQVMQAEAARVEPSVYMNPILLKPTNDCGSQVIVNGRVVGNMRAREYFQYKTSLIPEILHAVDKLEEIADVIVIEGAGSPAEVNLKQNDIVNMGMAKLVDAPVLLVGDIDRGGVFAQLLGTLELLEPDERDRVKGLIVNKFRGDPTLLDSGVEILEARGGVPVAGTLPYVTLALDDEDSLTDRFARRGDGAIRLGVVRLPHVANFTDFDVFDQLPDVDVRYVASPDELRGLDMLVIPGSKNTIEDMRRLLESGLAAAILRYHDAGGVIFGICGGYQMLGESIADPDGVESGGTVPGLALLPVRTTLRGEKRRRQVQGRVAAPTGVLAGLAGAEYVGYEIHMGETVPTTPVTPASAAAKGGNPEPTTATADSACALNFSANADAFREFTADGSGYCRGDVYGTYVHGIFDAQGIVRGVADALARRRGVSLELDAVVDYQTLKNREYDKLADMIRKHMNMELIYDLLGVERKS